MSKRLQSGLLSLVCCCFVTPDSVVVLLLLTLKDLKDVPVTALYESFTAAAVDCMAREAVTYWMQSDCS
jgi:hypothetical protein